MLNNLKHNLQLLKNRPMRAFYAIEGFLLWKLFRKDILKFLAKEFDKISELEADTHEFLVEFIVENWSGEDRPIVKWALKRYLLRFYKCTPCFYQGACVYCGCNVNHMFMSSMKCDGSTKPMG